MPLCFYCYHPGLGCITVVFLQVSLLSLSSPLLTIAPFVPSAPAIHAFCPFNVPSSSLTWALCTVWTSQFLLTRHSLPNLWKASCFSSLRLRLNITYLLRVLPWLPLPPVKRASHISWISLCSTHHWFLPLVCFVISHTRIWRIALSVLFTDHLHDLAGYLLHRRYSIIICWMNEHGLSSITTEQKGSCLVIHPGPCSVLCFPAISSVFFCFLPFTITRNKRPFLHFFYCSVHLEQCLACDMPSVPFYSMNEWMMNSSSSWGSKLSKYRIR